MAPYSMDLRERVVRASDASGDAEEVAATFRSQPCVGSPVGAAPTRTGSIAPRPQTRFRSRALAGQEARLAALIAARPDATWRNYGRRCLRLAALSTLWMEIDRLGLTVKKGLRQRTPPP